VPDAALPHALREALFTTKGVVGAHGIYTYTPADRHCVDSRARIMVQIENGSTSCCRNGSSRAQAWRSFALSARMSIARLRRLLQPRAS